MSSKKDIKYIDAMKRIEEILSKIESNSENFDIDELIEEVEEGANLISLCKKKLFNSEAKIQKVLESLEKEESPD